MILMNILHNLISFKQHEGVLCTKTEILIIFRSSTRMLADCRLCNDIIGSGNINLQGFELVEIKVVVKVDIRQVGKKHYQKKKY